MLCLYSSDLHGNRWIYERLFAEASSPAVGALLLGGDLSPLEPPLEVMIRKQRAFWTDDLRRRCEKLRDAGKRVLLVPGNDDLAANDDVIAAGHDGGAWELVDGRAVDLDGFRLLGCSKVSPTPFVLKDRELADVEPGDYPEADAIPLHDANTIFSAGREPGRLDRTLADELDALFADAAGPTILMAHCPPHGTALDVIHDGRHVGSRAVRAAIERHRPVLGLHGHIHESPKMPGGDWRDRVGETVVVNPGSSHHLRERAKLHLVSFDTSDVAGTIDWRRIA